MKIKLFLTVVVIFTALSTNAFAGSGLGLFAGFSSPNNEFNNVPALNDFSEEGMTDFLREGMSTGYHLGAKLRYALSDNFTFVGSAGFHKFPESTIDVKYPNQDSVVLQLNTTQNIIPITAGLNFYLFDKFVSLYGVGEISYNYIYGTIDANYGDFPVPIDETPTESRVGFGLGVGADIDIFLATLNLEAKYSIANFIGKESGEENKNYFALSLGIFF